MAPWGAPLSNAPKQTEGTFLFFILTHISFCIKSACFLCLSNLCEQCFRKRA